MSKSKAKSKSKPRSRSTTRAPKAKKTLGLSIRPALRLPHDDLIRPIDQIDLVDLRKDQIDLPDQRSDQLFEHTTVLNEPVRLTNPSEEITKPTTAINAGDQLSSVISTVTQSTVKINEPVRQTNQSVKQTGSLNDTGSPRTSPLNEPVRQTNQSTENNKGYLRIANEVMDRIIPSLSPFEQSVYLRLYRLSFGFGRATCTVGMSALIGACNIKETALRAALRRLMDLGLIQILEVKNSKEAKGTTYTVYASPQEELVRQTNRFAKQTGSPNEPNKDHDHDDLKKHDHHQSAHARETMTIYQSITGNSWSKADQAAYEKIKHLSLEAIEQGIKITNARAPQRPGSLAYFVKEVLSLANPSPASRSQRKRDLEAFVARVRTAHTGQAGYSIADFSADVKEMCAREGVIFDHELFNEILAKDNQPLSSS